MIAHGKRKLRTIKALLIALVLALTTDGAVAAEPVSVESRLEALEQQNAQLQRLLLEQAPVPPPAIAPASDKQIGAPALPIPAAPAATAAPASVTEAMLPPPPAPPSSGAVSAVWNDAALPPLPSDSPPPPRVSAPSYTAPTLRSEDPLSMSAKWNYGLEWQSKDKNFRIHVGGRSQVDAVFIDGNPAAFLSTGPGDKDGDSLNLRRGRLRVDGTLYQFIDFACEYDFVNDFSNQPLLTPIAESDAIVTPAVTDLWVTIRDVPFVGNVRMGNFKEPIGFDHLHSSRFLNFMERSFNQDAFNGPFNNGFSPGIMIYDTYADEYGTWATGFFKNGYNIFGYGIGDGEYAWTSRLTGLLYYDDETKGADLLHVGVAGSIRDPNNGLVQYRSRGSLRNGPPGPLNPVFANTLPFVTSRVDLWTVELSWQRGPLLVNAEFEGNLNHDAVGNGISAPAGVPLGTVHFHGWYVEALYFLTGEHRDYDRHAGVYGRVIPNRNFGWNTGPGAWQIGARYSQLDLRDTGINGGFLQDVTLGLNWFLNPNMKLQFNYVYMDRGAVGTSPGGVIHGAGTRLAWDF